MILLRRGYYDSSLVISTIIQCRGSPRKEASNSMQPELKQHTSGRDGKEVRELSHTSFGASLRVHDVVGHKRHKSTSCDKRTHHVDAEVSSVKCRISRFLSQHIMLIVK